MDQQEKSSAGAIIGILVIVIILIIGGIYFWGKGSQNLNPGQTATSTEQASVASDEIGSIETDLNSTTKDVNELNTNL